MALTQEQIKGRIRNIAKDNKADARILIRNMNLSKSDVKTFVTEICSINLDDEVSFIIKDISDIMGEMECPGIRVSLDAVMGKMITSIKIDISTGDVITPRAI